MGQRRNSRLLQRDVFRRPHFESLEPRRLMAGNVTAEVIDGDLIITGDEAANVIRVTRNSAGDIVVEHDRVWQNVRNWQPGVNGGSHGALVLVDSTTVNNSADNAAFSGVTGDIIIRAGAGDDRILIGQSPSADQASRTAFVLSGDVLIDAEAGDDLIVIGGVASGFFEGTHSFSEPTFFVDAMIGGQLSINTGADGGSVTVHSTDVAGALSIDNSASTNAPAELRLFSVKARSVHITGGEAAEKIDVLLVRTGTDVRITAAGGRDQISVYGNIDGELIIVGGTQPDIVHLGGQFFPPVLDFDPELIPIDVHMSVPVAAAPPDPLREMERGAGGSLVVNGNLWVDSGGGDFVNVQNTTTPTWLRINSGNTSSPEYVRLHNVFADSLTIDAAGDDDIVHLAYVRSINSFSIDLGAGNDVLVASVVASDGITRYMSQFNITRLVPVAVIGGGEGTDTLDFAGARFSGASFFHTGTGDDRMTFTASLLLDPNSEIDTGDGDDHLRIEYSSTAKLQIDSGSGNDTVAAYIMAVDQLFVSLGEGDDMLDVWGCILLQSSDADGGAGVDTFNRLHSRIKQFNATNFEAGNDAGLLFE